MKLTKLSWPSAWHSLSRNTLACSLLIGTGYMCVCVYMCMYVYIHAYVCVCIWLLPPHWHRLHVCMRIYVYVCIYICVYMRSIYMRIYVYVPPHGHRLHACMHIYVYVYTVHTHADHISTHICVNHNHSRMHDSKGQKKHKHMCMYVCG